LGKFQSHFPKWGITRSLDQILNEIVTAETAQRQTAARA